VSTLPIRPWWARRSGRQLDDQGFFALWTVVMTLAFWGLVGLLADAGLVMRERSNAFGAAAGAGRAAAQAIDQDAVLLDGEVRLDEDEAIRRGNEYLRDRDFGGSVRVDDLEVIVTVRGDTDLRFLPGSVHYDIEATVRAVQSGGAGG
jgi:hypothetical protein